MRGVKGPSPSAGLRSPRVRPDMCNKKNDSMVPIVNVSTAGATPAPREAARLIAGDIVLDLSRYRLHRAGRRIPIGIREFRILALLMRHPGHVHSRAQILDGVWGSDAAVTDRSVDVYVRRLRAALNASGMPDPIRTVRGAGYAFDEYYRADSLSPELMATRPAFPDKR